MNRKSEDERIDFFLVVKRWTGEITNKEPHKCDDMGWFELSKLPANTIPYVRQAIDCTFKKKPYSEFGWTE